MSVSTLHKTLWTTFFQVSNSRKPLVGWIPSLAFRDDWSIKHTHVSINHCLFLLSLISTALCTYYCSWSFWLKKKTMKLFLVEPWEFPTIFLVCDFWKHIEGQEPTSLRRLCSTFCNLNPGNTRFSVFELFKGLYINPRLLLLILVCFELAKV